MKNQKPLSAPARGGWVNVYRPVGVACLVLLFLGTLVFGSAVLAQSRKSGNSRRVKPARTRKSAAVTPSGRNDNEPIQEDVEGRDNWFWSQRTYPFNDIPLNARRDAWNARPIIKGMSAEALTWKRIVRDFETVLSDVAA